MGVPLRDSAVCEPLAVMHLWQLSWLQALGNSPGLVGVVHQALACHGGIQEDHSQALRSALQSVGWTVQCNVARARALPWPCPQPGPSYPGEICLTPMDSLPLPRAVSTDESLGGPGGAATRLPKHLLACFTLAMHPFSQAGIDAV